MTSSLAYEKRFPNTLSSFVPKILFSSPIFIKLLKNSKIGQLKIYYSLVTS